MSAAFQWCGYECAFDEDGGLEAVSLEDRTEALAHFDDPPPTPDELIASYASEIEKEHEAWCEDDALDARGRR